MSAENPRLPIELPELTSTRFGLASADVQVTTGGSELVHPQLVFEGEDDAFEHSFTDGRLNVRENSQGGTVVNRIGSGRGFSSVIIGNGNFDGVVISGGSIRVNGMDISVGDSASISTARRRASLLLPQGHPASHDIDTKAGDVELEGLTARILKIATQSGDIALRGSQVEAVTLKTMSGDVEIEDTKSPSSVSATTMSGDVDVSGSEAPSWRLSTMSGDVKVKTTKGEVDASSMSGRTRISQ
jgi:hypothetical protein